MPDTQNPTNPTPQTPGQMVGAPDPAIVGGGTPTPQPQTQAPATAPVQPQTQGPITSAPASDGGAKVSFSSAMASGNSATAILRGALEGALRGATRAVVGSRTAPSTPAQQPRTGGALQKVGNVATNFLRAQPAFQQRVKSQDEHLAALDDATAKKVVNNLNATRAVHEQQQMNYEKNKNDQEQQDRLKKFADDRRKNLAELTAAGVTFGTDHGAGTDGLTASHAKDIANGDTGLIYNGEGGFVTTDNNNLPALSAPAEVTAGWSVDKDGNLQPKKVTLPAGTSGEDALALVHFASDQYDKLATQLKAQAD